MVVPFPEAEQAPPRECKQLYALRDGVVESALVQT